jgi:hypothetical protein
LEPCRPEEGHPDDMAPLVLTSDVLKEDALQLETEPGSKIEVPDVGIRRMYLNLLELPDREGAAKERTGGAFADSLAVHG